MAFASRAWSSAKRRRAMKNSSTAGGGGGDERRHLEAQVFQLRLCGQAGGGREGRRQGADDALVGATWSQPVEAAPGRR